MKLAFCTEDESDAEILRALVSRLLGEEVTALVQHYRFERGGWSKALKLAPIIAAAVYRTDATGALFAIDNDEAEPVHDETHEVAPVNTCRYCALVSAAQVERVLAWPRPGLAPLRFFFAVPVRTIESWLVLARPRPSVPESAQTLGRTASERRELKRLVYGTDRPDQALMIKRGRELVAGADLDALARTSPSFALFRLQLARPAQVVCP